MPRFPLGGFSCLVLDRIYSREFLSIFSTLFRGAFVHIERYTRGPSRVFTSPCSIAMEHMLDESDEHSSYTPKTHNFENNDNLTKPLRS